MSPLAVCLPIGAHHALYSQKMPLACAGSVRLAGNVRPQRRGGDDRRAPSLLSAPDNLALGDGRWRSEHGVLCGFNLTRNQARQPERFNECALWHGGRLYRLPLPALECPIGRLRLGGSPARTAPSSLRLSRRACAKITPGLGLGEPIPTALGHFVVASRCPSWRSRRRRLRGLRGPPSCMVAAAAMLSRGNSGA